MSEKKYRIMDPITRCVYADNMDIEIATLLVKAWAERWYDEPLSMLIEECPKAEVET